MLNKPPKRPNGIHYHHPKWQEYKRQVNKIVWEMRHNGATYREIGEYLGFTHNRARQIFKKLERKQQFAELKAKFNQPL